MAKGNRGGKRAGTNNTSISRYSQVLPQNLKIGEVIYPNQNTRWTYADNKQGSFTLQVANPIIIDNVKSTGKTTKITGYMIIDGGTLTTPKSRLVTHTYKNSEDIKKVNGSVKMSKGAGGHTITLDYAKKIRVVK